MKQFILLFALWAGLLFSESEIRAEYLTPKEAGFRNCALIYYNENYNAERIKPILVKYADGKPTAQQGYDAILFLLYSINGKETLTEKTNKTDWQEQIAIYFHRGINVPALDAAANDLRSGGFLKDRIKVIFSIPWPHPKMNDFGDVDGDGRSEDLGTPEGIGKVLDWYIGEVAKEMEKYPELEFWGFYMMNEGLHEKNHDLVRLFCKKIHDHGTRALWIPYYNAPGADKAYELGFDASIMQSNWTFGTRPDGSGTHRNRLFNTADWAKKHRHGIELEINPPEVPYFQDIFARTLETGTLTGFQQAASATYFGSDFYWAASDRKETQDLYSLWMDYLAGKPIRLPKLGHWTQKERADGSLEILYRFEKPTALHLVDLYFRDIPDDSFNVSILAEGRGKKSSEWIPLAWKNSWVIKNALRPIEDLAVLFAPVELEELRIVLNPKPGMRMGKIAGVEPEPFAEKMYLSKSYRKPYTTNKIQSDPTYPDESGRDLFDGVCKGSWKNYIGWMPGRPADISFDFSDEIEYDEVRLHLLEDRSAAITWPEKIELVSSLRPGKQEYEGFGAFPGGYAFESDFRGDPSSGSSILKLDTPKKARGLTIRFTRTGWIFLSEVEFLRRGKKLSTDRIHYTLSQLDRSTQEISRKYSDDGSMLTDGFVSSSFTKGALGRNDGKPLAATVDLQEPAKIRRVICWLLDGQQAGIRVPKKGSVRFSNDGKIWSDPVPFEMPASQKRPSVFALPVQINTDQTARYVEVSFSTNNWTFLSEILID
ncbi:MAG: DUF4855 domain-containing protein [Planctomycetia bacterium]|nr:DUF4855 domain-containing protein [Planctomycetia bacterium]